MGTDIKNMKRAVRRHHYKRLKKKRQNYWGKSLSAERIGFVVNTPHPCSCYLCGNPRKHFGQLTIQEIKQKEKEARVCALLASEKRRG